MQVDKNKYTNMYNIKTNKQKQTHPQFYTHTQKANNIRILLVCIKSLRNIGK